MRSDPCVYVRPQDEGVVIVTVWVDNLLLFADSADAMEKMKKDIRTKWEVTDMGEPTKIVGIKITQTPKTISISQKKSIETILQKQGLVSVNPVKMPLDPGMKLVLNPEGNEGDQSNSFAQLLRELQFVANATRPDIGFAVNHLALYMANLSI